MTALAASNCSMNTPFCSQIVAVRRGCCATSAFELTLALACKRLLNDFMSGQAKHPNILLACHASNAAVQSILQIDEAAQDEDVLNEKSFVAGTFWCRTYELHAHTFHCTLHMHFEHCQRTPTS